MVLVGTNHVLTLAPSKQENAAVENANKRSQEYMRSMLTDEVITYQQISVALSPFDGVLLSRLEGVWAGQAFQSCNLFRHRRFESIHAQLLDKP